MDEQDVELEGLKTALRVVQEKIDEVIVKRNMEQIKSSEYCVKKKTRALATFFAGLGEGFQIVGLTTKEEKQSEAKPAALIWELHPVTERFLKTLCVKPVGEKVSVDLEKEFVAEAKRDKFRSLCDQLYDKGMRHKGKKSVEDCWLEKGSGRKFLTGAWAEYVTQAVVRQELDRFAKENAGKKLRVDLFQNVKLARIGQADGKIAWELDVVAQVDDRFYVFETKTSLDLALEKWIEWTRMMRGTGRGNFITCCASEDLPCKSFKPYTLVSLAKLPETFGKMLRTDLKDLSGPECR